MERETIRRIAEMRIKDNEEDRKFIDLCKRSGTCPMCGDKLVVNKTFWKYHFKSLIDIKCNNCSYSYEHNTETSCYFH